MKRFLLAALFLTLLFVASAQFTQLPHSKVTVKVVGENQEPIVDAKVAFVFLKANEDKEAPIVGLTDADGGISREGSSLNILSGSVEKEGYYRSDFQSKQFQRAVEGKWQPWNPTLEVVLRRIVKPIPMYAKKVNTDVPATDAPVGYDLVEGDWVAPHGRGKASDLMFTLTRRFKDDRDYETSLVVSFAPTADGIQTWDNKAGYWSTLKLPRLAPEVGYAQPLVLANKRLPGAFVERDVKEERNYFFRVRSVVDQQGNVVSAQYGKIDGDIRFSPIRSKTCSVMFTYYLNPTPNDRNMEFDPSRNMLTRMSVDERVTSP